MNNNYGPELDAHSQILIDAVTLGIPNKVLPELKELNEDYKWQLDKRCLELQNIVRD